MKEEFKQIFEAIDAENGFSYEDEETGISFKIIKKKIGYGASGIVLEGTLLLYNLLQQMFR